MNKGLLFYFIFFFLFPISGCFEIYSQEPLWKLASDYEKAGNYPEAIRLKKQMAKEDAGTEWFIDDIAGIARCYSYTSCNDSTLYYGEYAIELAKTLINKTDSIAEEYIQNSAWCFYRSNMYPQAVNASEMVLSLRENLHGKSSTKYLEWLGVMSYQAFNHNQIDDMVKYCDKEIALVKECHGLQSRLYEEAISSIRGYAHQLVDVMPEFTTNWILPYYHELLENNILPQYQYEFEILQMEGFLSMEDLRDADIYAHKLERWTYSNATYKIPLEDKVRISLKLANHYLHMGDHYKSRFRVEEAWKYLSNANVMPSMAVLVDRHIVERQLRMDTLGRSRINAEWIIETASPIINAGIEDSDILAFFYDSRAWAYEGLNDYDNAINDMQNAVRLNPLYSRKKKLAQFYLAKKNYELAERLFLEIYKDPQTPEVGKRSIEADLTSLYWLWGKLDELEKYLKIDFSNMKADVRNAFAFMNDEERENYLDQSLMGGVIKYDFYTAYSKDDAQWNEGNCHAYNMALIQKGLLLETTRDIERLMQSVPDSLKQDLEYYKLWKSVDNIGIEDSFSREHRLNLMSYVSEQPSFLQQLNVVWTDIRDSLKENEAAIEFINLWGVTPENINSPENMQPCIGALILRKDMDYPTFVRIAANETVVSLFEHDEEGALIPDEIYTGNKKETLYNLVWSPLMPYLEGVKNVYYAPAGYIHNINLDWIGLSEDDYLSEQFNMYRVSSTRQILKRCESMLSVDALLMGDIEYSITNGVATESPITKYRSISRTGFGPLKKTANEVKSISDTLTVHRYVNTVLTRLSADETSVRALSGHAPTILHFATHGFYYPKEKLEEEFKKSSFIGFQCRMPELFHSGIALAGAQDTWYNESIGDSISFEKYYSMDPASDGVLLSSEISELNLENTDLVVLSACETALGDIKTEGVYGLQRAFKLSGVKSLIMSLWKVDDEATQKLMTAFYQYYLNGLSKREALIAAQKTVKRTLGFEHPYNWAGFILLDGLN